ncbi:MAG TPA: ribosomal protein S18-alanine N-acetyltransferase [Bryobacteraceae bacterium]|jgi:ribosomal-protein-alanine N-acetyltransferase|nr:ribosomal protein S18-alanine N-acetyltransferase [Bryobacteraceae bacterium]
MAIAPVNTRAAKKIDLPSIESIQASSPEASHWYAQDYFAYNLIVAEIENEVVGFLCWREIAGEGEILNLAVLPTHRRQGIAKVLLQQIPKLERVFLEVRASNKAAITLYMSHGFRVSGKRLKYYSDPEEDAVVMIL